MAAIQKIISTSLVVWSPIKTYVNLVFIVKGNNIVFTIKKQILAET